ncbi:MAG: ABC transporter substrate-binding protein [Hyphomicrobiales bacterium]|nr:ABC transporter substrate-binding protein [Hyphomicrobiales bacterium]MBV8441183.1 ABC transporter substrate-binding protein [Hyphomicrobiales bacterium]
MKTPKRLLLLAAVLCALLTAEGAYAASNKVVIGDIDDMSGPYADIIGAGGVEAIKMAISDFGGTALGQPIELMTFDHQNKPDLGAQKLREWADTDGLTMLLGGSNSGVSLAMSAAAKEKKIPFFAIGAAAASLTGKDCTPYTVHYGYDTTALANGTAKTILEEGGKSWFFLTADYAFGKQLEAGAAEVVKSGGGSVVGDVRVPLGTSDFSSYLLQAQGSGAQVLGLANAGTDTSNSMKAAAEFGLTKTMRPAALLVFISDVHAMGLDIAQGLVLTTAWYWNLDDTTRAFSKRFYEKTKREPTFPQAAMYSATLTYLNAVKAAGTTDPDKIMDEVRKTKINDAFVTDGVIRPDGLLEHDMYIVQVKTPAESKGAWDYYKVLKTMKGEEAFGKLADSACPLVKK